MKMEGSKESDDNMDICTSKGNNLQRDEEFKDSELEKFENGCNVSNFEPNGLGRKISPEKREQEKTELRPPKVFLPVLVDVWTKMSPEIRHAYKIFRELLNDKNRAIIEPFLDAVDSSEPGLSDYYEVIKMPIDLFQISEKFHEMQYTSITELAADLRQMIENCYRYNGIDSYVSKQAYKLEVILEQKLALLSRELRNKTSIAATNIARQKEFLNGLLFTSGGRRLSRKPTNGEVSQIALQMQLQDELEEKEKKRMKEKEKKELNEALEEELEIWWKDVSRSDAMTELGATWEVPSVGIFIFVLKDFLNLQDLNYSEFELATLYPEKSSLMARIFTSLLVTPFQRLKLNRKDPMKYSAWEAKVNTKISSWYKMAGSRGQEYAASLFGFDPDLFEILGNANPFENLKYHQLPLKQRMWIMKALCEAALEQDSAMRDHFADLDFLDRQDLCLGSDSDGFSYHYFSAFGTTDVRIYKQKAMREPCIRKVKNQTVGLITPKKEPFVKEDDLSKKQETIKLMEKEVKTPGVRTSNRIKTKKSLSPPSEKTTSVKKEKKSKNQPVKEFELIVSDIPSLSMLVDKVANLVKTKGHRRTPEKELHQTLEALLVELEKREANLLKCSQKARLKVMQECRQKEEHTAMQNEVEDKPQVCWGSEDEDEDEEEIENISEKIKQEASPPEIAHFISSNIEGSQVTEAVPMDTAASPLSSEILSKEGRRLRKKRFDVKQLFSEHDPPRKRQKTEMAKPTSHGEPIKSTVISSSEISETGYFGTPDQKCLRNRSIDGVHNTLPAEMLVKRSKMDARYSGSNCNAKAGKEGNSLFAENGTRASKHKKQKKKKKSSKKRSGHYAEKGVVKSELSDEQIAALKLHRKLEHEKKLERERKLYKKEMSTPDATTYCAYDGLKALADIASLAQKHIPQIQKCEKPSKCSKNSTVSSRNLEKPQSSLAETRVKDFSSSKECSALKQAALKSTIGRSSSMILTNGSNDHKNVPSSSAVSDDIFRQKICITSSTPKPFLNKNVAASASVIDKPLILQWKRPNILRKPKSAATVSPSKATIEKNTKDSTKLSEPFCSLNGNASVSQELKTWTATNAQSDVSTISYAENQNGIPISSKEISEQAITSQIDSITSSKGTHAVSSNVTSLGTQDSASAKTTIQAAGYATSTANVSMAPQVVTNRGIPVILQQPVAPTTLITNQSLAQPIMLIPGNQQLFHQVPKSLDQTIAIPTQLVATGQGEQKVIVQQQGNVLTLHPPQPVFTVASLAGNSVVEPVKEEALTKCPVTTLKSKLHAAALKKRCTYRGKLDPSVLSPIAIPKLEPLAPISDSSTISSNITSDFSRSTIQIVRQSDQNIESPASAGKIILPSRNTTALSRTVSRNTKKSETCLQPDISHIVVKSSTHSPARNIVIVTSTVSQKKAFNTAVCSISKASPQAPSEFQQTKSIQIIKSNKKSIKASSSNQVMIPPASSFSKKTTVIGTSTLSQPIVSIVKQLPMNSDHSRKPSTLQPIQPAIQSQSSMLQKAQTSTSTAIFITPTGITFGGTAYPAAVPIVPLSAKVVHLPGPSPVVSATSCDLPRNIAQTNPVASQVLPLIAPKQETAVATTEQNQIHKLSTSSVGNSLQPVQILTPAISSQVQQPGSRSLSLQQSYSAVSDKKPLPSTSRNPCHSVSHFSTSMPKDTEVNCITGTNLSTAMTKQESSETILEAPTNGSLENTANPQIAHSNITVSSTICSKSSDQEVTASLRSADATPVVSDRSFVTFSVVSPIPHAGLSLTGSQDVQISTSDLHLSNGHAGGN